MNKQSIYRALDNIEEAVDPEEIKSAVAQIRMEVASDRLRPEDYFAVKFEAGKSYMIFVEQTSVDPQALMAAPDEFPPYDLTFVFAYGDGRPLRDKFLVVEGVVVAGSDSGAGGKRVFADDRYVNEMEGVVLVDTGGRDLGEVLIAEK